MCYHESAECCSAPAYCRWSIGWVAPEQLTENAIQVWFFAIKSDFFWVWWLGILLACWKPGQLILWCGSSCCSLTPVSGGSHCRWVVVATLCHCFGKPLAIKLLSCWPCWLFMVVLITKLHHLQSILLEYWMSVIDPTLMIYIVDNAWQPVLRISTYIVICTLNDGPPGYWAPGYWAPGYWGTAMTPGQYVKCEGRGGVTSNWVSFHRMRSSRCRTFHSQLVAAPVMFGKIITQLCTLVILLSPHSHICWWQSK